MILTFDEFVNEKLDKRDFEYVENYIDRIFGKRNIDVVFTNHFKERINDDRNVRDITVRELISIFKKTYDEYGEKLAMADYDYEACIKDFETDINIPLIIKKPNYGTKDAMVLKTAMRKHNFKTDNFDAEDLPLH